MPQSFVSRCFKSAAVVTTSLLLGCASTSSPARLTAAHDGRYPIGEAAAVYRTVLDTLYGFVERPPFVILSNSTIPVTIDCVIAPCSTLPPHHSSVDASTLQAFEALRKPPLLPLRVDFGYRLPIVLIGEVEEHELTVLGEQIAAEIGGLRKLNDMPLWAGLRRRYPGAWGRTTLSPVAFNSSSTQALVTVWHACGGYCSSIEDMLLEKHGQSWQVIERMPLRAANQEWLTNVTLHGRDSADDYQVLDSFRYLGPNAHMRRDFAEREDSAKRAVADSLARDRAPTRVAGRVLDEPTRKPIPRATVVSHTPPGNQERYTVADSAGAFVFHNLREWSVLEVRCPGTVDPAKTLASPPFTMRPALDTTITILVPHLGPCRY